MATSAPAGNPSRSKAAGVARTLDPQHHDPKPHAKQPGGGTLSLATKPHSSVIASCKQPHKAAVRSSNPHITNSSYTSQLPVHHAAARPALPPKPPKPTPPLKNDARDHTPAPGFLHGVTACFWSNSHTRRIKSLLVEHGAMHQTAASPASTHIVLEDDVLTARHAAARLEQELEQRRRSSQEELRPHRTSLEAARTQRPSQRPTPTPLPSSQRQPAVWFVNPKYFTACMQQKPPRRLPEEGYTTRFKPPELDTRPGPEPPPSPPATPSAPSLLPPPPPGRSESPVRSSQACVGSARTRSVEPPAAPVPSALQSQAQLAPNPQPLIVTGTSGEPAPGNAGRPEAATCAAAAPAAAATHLPSAAAAAATAAAQPATSRSSVAVVEPQASEICPSLDTWGVDGRWIEPWDPAQVQDTLLKLFNVWQPSATSPKRSWAAAAGAGAGAGPHPGGTSACATAATALVPASGTEAGDGGRAAKKLRVDGAAASDAPGSKPGAVVRNEACPHAACAAQRYCFVPVLERVLSNYPPRDKAYQFKRKAIMKAISLLKGLKEAIKQPLDVDRLLGQLGDKTREKIKEILASGGTYQRNEDREADERLQTEAKFVEVWGAGQATAELWYNRGCRTLEDVSSQPHLTDMQRLGLKYHADFQVRVPRQEVQEAETIIRRCFVQVLEELTRLSADVLRQRLHVRAAGSYMRGRLDSSDIDLLIAPPPAAYTAAAYSEDSEKLLRPHRLLQLLLDKLVALGRVIDHLGLEDTSGGGSSRLYASGRHRSATFMGVWRSAGSATARRIDIKIYPFAALPFALNYFCSSTSFSRAIRHYGKWGVSRETVAASTALGDHFRLTDNELQPMVMVCGQEVVAGPPIPARCETDIFSAMGLHYVPPHLRNVEW